MIKILTIFTLPLALTVFKRGIRMMMKTGPVPVHKAIVDEDGLGLVLWRPRTRPWGMRPGPWRQRPNQ